MLDKGLQDSVSQITPGEWAGLGVPWAEVKCLPQCHFRGEDLLSLTLALCVVPVAAVVPSSTPPPAPVWCAQGQGVSW